MSGEEDNSVYDETLSRTSAEAEVPVSETDVHASKRTVRRTVTVAKPDQVTDIPADTTLHGTPASVEYEVHSVERTAASGDEESVSAKAREAGRSFKNLAQSVAQKTRKVTEQKVSELRSESAESGTAVDARDINGLGGHVDSQVQVFEDTMLEIGREPYLEQERMLTGYHKLLEEQINVIDARLELARRLKAT